MADRAPSGTKAPPSMWRGDGAAESGGDPARGLPPVPTQDLRDPGQASIFDRDGAGPGPAEGVPQELGSGDCPELGPQLALILDAFSRKLAKALPMGLAAAHDHGGQDVVESGSVLVLL